MHVTATPCHVVRRATTVRRELVDGGIVLERGLGAVCRLMKVFAHLRHAVVREALDARAANV